MNFMGICLLADQKVHECLLSYDTIEQKVELFLKLFLNPDA